MAEREGGICSHPGTGAMESRTDTGVLIVDDHRAFADLLAAALSSQPNIRVVGTANSADAALRAAAALRPDALIMDIQLGGGDGLQTARNIRSILPDVLVIVVSAHTDPAWLVRAAGAGAHGYVPKSAPLDELLMVLYEARLGQFLVAPSLRRHPLAEAPDPVPVPLTGREADVLSLLADGVGPAQIARILSISVHTCRGYVKALYAKLDARSQLEALAAARRRGLLANGDEYSG